MFYFRNKPVYPIKRATAAEGIKAYHKYKKGDERIRRKLRRHIEKGFDKIGKQILKLIWR